MYWISKKWVILLCRIWPTLVFRPDFAENRFLILEEIVLWFFRDFFPILKKIVFWIIGKSFLIFSRFYSDFEENRFLIFSWFLETRFIKLICIRKNTEKIVCKSRDFITILSTIYSTIFLVWVVTVAIVWKLAKLEHFFFFFLADLRGGGANVPSAPSESATADRKITVEGDRLWHNPNRGISRGLDVKACRPRLISSDLEREVILDSFSRWILTIKCILSAFLLLFDA